MVAVVLVAELFGQGSLIIEQQAVFLAVTEAVQGIAYPPEKGLTTAQVIIFTRSQEAVTDQLLQAGSAEMASRYPGNHLDIP